MERVISARVAIAGPVALLAALLGMAVAAALSNVAQWSVYVVVSILPVALCLWLSPRASLSTRALLMSATLIASLGVAAAVVLLLLPLFEVTGVGISGAGVYTLLWGPTIVVLLGSVGARAHSGAPLFGAWLIWWIAVAASMIWAEPLTYALTDLAGADAMAGTVAVLAAPTVGMSAWVGSVVVLLGQARFAPSHPSGASI